VLPLLSRNVAADTKLNIAPVILLALLMIVLRRASNPDVVRSKD
jgi:hypothetical protein